MATVGSKEKRLRCRLGIHKYVLRLNDTGERFHECKYCQHFDPRSSSTGGGAGYALG